MRWINGRVHCSFVRPVSTTFYTYKHSRYGGQKMHIYNDLFSNEYYFVCGFRRCLPRQVTLCRNDFLQNVNYHEMNFSHLDLWFLIFYAKNKANMTDAQTFLKDLLNVEDILSLQDYPIEK